MSQHLLLEIEASDPGNQLPAGAPVPGCKCPHCTMLKAGINSGTVDETGAIVRWLARIHPDERLEAAHVEAKLAVGIVPSAEWLCRLAEDAHGARRAYKGQGLPVELARSVPILDAAEALQMDIKKMGASHRGPCPVHKGEGSNLSIDPKRAAFKCFVCDVGGDVIDLVMAVRGSTFPQAVRELAGIAGATQRGG